MITERDVIFHVDTGCSQQVLVQRLLQAPDCGNSTRAEIEQLISKMLKEKVLYVKSKGNNDRYLKIGI